MTNTNLRFRLLPAAAALLAACNSAAGANAGAGPGLEPLGTLTLQESGGVYLARPGGMSMDDAGNLFITDFFQKHIVQYDPAGRPVATFGAPGGGPGEFVAIGETVLLHDSLVAALDYRQRVFNIFSRSSRRYLGGRRVEGTVTTGSVSGGQAWLAHIDRERKLGMSVWDLREEQAGPRSLRHAPLRADRVPLPDEYLESEALRGTFPLVFAAPWADSVLVAFSGTDWLLALDGSSRVVDTVFVPVRARRGMPGDLVERLNRPRVDFREIFGMVSGQYGVSRTREGNFVLVHFDPQLHEGNRITGRVFVSLVSRDRRRACVDREIPVSDASQPLVALRGDTLLVLEQHLVGDAGASTTLKRYRVTPAGCDWVATRNGRKKA